MNLICDSSNAYNWASRKFSQKETNFYSSSPSLLLNKEYKINNLEIAWSPKKIKEFSDEIEEHTFNIFLIAKNKYGLEHEKAITFAHNSFLFQRYIYKVACLKKFKKDQPPIYIRPHFKIKEFASINFPWAEVAGLKEIDMSKNNFNEDEEYSKANYLGRIPFFLRLKNA